MCSKSFRTIQVFTLFTWHDPCSNKTFTSKIFRQNLAQQFDNKIFRQNYSKHCAVCAAPLNWHLRRRELTKATHYALLLLRGAENTRTTTLGSLCAVRLFERAQLARRGSSPKSYIDACVCIILRCWWKKQQLLLILLPEMKAIFWGGKIKNIEFENGILVTIERFQAWRGLFFFKIHILNIKIPGDSQLLHIFLRNMCL